MDELKEVIVEFLSLNKYLYHRRVQKYVFAGEIWSAQETGHRLTDASFCPYNYGPYSKAVEQALEELTDEERISCESSYGKNKYETDEQGGELSPRKKFVVKQVWEEYKGVPTEDVIRDVKDSWVYENYKQCEEIDFAKYIDEYVRPPEGEDIPEEKNPISIEETAEILTT